MERVEQMMPDDEAQKANRFIEEFLRNYPNPRGLPVNYIKSYLRRDKPQLAIDVLRAYDSHSKINRALRRTILILGVLNGLLGVLATLLALYR